MSSSFEVILDTTPPELVLTQLQHEVDRMAIHYEVSEPAAVEGLYEDDSGTTVGLAGLTTGELSAELPDGLIGEGVLVVTARDEVWNEGRRLIVIRQSGASGHEAYGGAGALSRSTKGGLTRATGARGVSERGGDPASGTTGDA